MDIIVIASIVWLIVFLVCKPKSVESGLRLIKKVKRNTKLFLILIEGGIAFDYDGTWGVKLFVFIVTYIIMYLFVDIFFLSAFRLKYVNMFQLNKGMLRRCVFLSFVPFFGTRMIKCLVRFPLKVVDTTMGDDW